ncbi:MAG: class I SAM-dependent methyltransferase [Gammaproteobacteria bacterium]|nr:class I SAM-dependent methyltransferase [Gammaproteobacteria bacterium]
MINSVYSKIRDIQRYGFKAKSVVPFSPRFSRCDILDIKTDHGSYYFANDEHTHQVLSDLPKYSSRLSNFIEFVTPLINQNSILLDINSDVGIRSVLMSKYVKPNGLVFAFEKNEFKHYLAQRNTDRYTCRNVRTFLCETGDHAHASFLGIDSLKISQSISLMCISYDSYSFNIIKNAKKTIERNSMPIVIQKNGDREFSSDVIEEIEKYLCEISYRMKEFTKEGIVLFERKQEQSKNNLKTVSSLYEERYTGHFKKEDLITSGFLLTQTQVDNCTEFLAINGYVPHQAECKNWDLANILPRISVGSCLDMGSSDSHLLRNLVLKGIEGELHGVDLRKPNIPLSGVQYQVADLMDTKLPSCYFNHITCLSVIEHGVNYEKFAKETARLLALNGRLYVTFDYWQPKIEPNMQLFGLPWTPLDREMTEDLIQICETHGLTLIEPMVWSTGDAVITPDNYSPNHMSYTFGLLIFEKVK